MKLAIADPPYPPLRREDGRTHRRASRYYGGRPLSKTDNGPDFHPDAARWDDPKNHRLLLESLLDQYDGFAIATAPDGLEAYAPLPAACKILSWVKPTAPPGSHLIRTMWEPVICLTPKGRRSNRAMGRSVPGVLIQAAPRKNFVGAKPAEWFAWVRVWLERVDRKGTAQTDYDPQFGGSWIEWEYTLR